MKKIFLVLSLFISLLACAQDRKISELIPASTLSGTELVPIVQGNVNKKALSNLFVLSTVTYNDPVWLQTLAWSKIIGAPSFVLTTGSYANPSWITSLDYSKITNGPGASRYEGASPTSVTVGGLSSGSPIHNRTYDSILQAILVPYIHPTFTSFSNSQSTSVEVGTTLSGSKTFTWSITLGSGVVTTIDLFDNTAGTPLAINTPNDGTQAQIINTFQLNSNGATQSWKGIGHDTGGSPGNFNSSNYVVTAWFKDFYGNTASNSTTSANVRALPQNSFHTGPVTNILNTGSTNVIFEYACQCIISQVIDLDALNADITSQYLNTGTIGVLDAGGTSRTTTIWRMTAGVPYSTNHRHQITTSN